MSTDSPISVMVLGLRGFPDVQGGVESHAQALYPRLVKKGFDINVLCRSPYVDTSLKEWRGIRFHALWSPSSQGMEALLHSLLGVFYAGVKRPDILHIHAIGPAIVTPVARLLGLTVVITHHGPDYEREKWGGFARFVLKAGESFGMRFANRRIVISRVIRSLVKDKYQKNSDLVPNGVAPAGSSGDGEVLKELGLDAGRYVLLVSRMVPEKRHIDLIRAFRKSVLPGWKLALVGDISKAGSYVQMVIGEAGDRGDVVLGGFRSGAALDDLFSNAGIFVLPSSHEGLPIALLEAMSFGLPVLASGIPPHLELDLDSRCYFRLGDVDDLCEKIESLVEDTAFCQQQVDFGKRLVREKYDWDEVAAKTADVYRKALGR